MSTRRSLLQTLSIVVTLTLLFSGFSLPSASAQGNDGRERQVNPETSKANFVSAGNGRAFSASLKDGSDAIQDPALTPSPTETPDVGLTPVPTIEGTGSQEGASRLDVSASNAIPLAAATWYVKTTGNDSNSCSTPALPCRTINGAIGKAANDDTIHIQEGMYTNPEVGSYVPVITIDKNLTLAGGWNSGFSSQTGYSTIDGQQLGRVVSIYGGKSVVMNRFMITNGKLLGAWGSGITNSGNLKLTDAIVTNNLTTGIANFGSITLENVTVSNNSGAGITSDSGTSLVINNSTISNNSSPSQGGGILAYGLNVTINNTTISNNTAVIGAGIYRGDGTVLIKNTILSGNIATSSGSDCAGTITSAGHNIIGNTMGCSVTTGSGDQFNVDPKLGPFIEPKGYHALAPTSPAIDAGDDSTCYGSADQRGQPRSDGPDADAIVTCDIGAYEYTTPATPSMVIPVSGGGRYTLPNMTFPQLLKAIVVDNKGSPVSAGVQVLFTAPASGASGTFAGAGNTISVLTDEFGVATAPSFTANSNFGPYVVRATVAGVTGSAEFALENAGWYASPTGSDTNDCKTPWTSCAIINTVYNKAQAGETIFVAIGTYKGTGDAVLTLNKDIKFSGGWNTSFTVQDGFSTINGEDIRSGILVTSTVTATLDKFVIEHSQNYNIQRGAISNDGILTLNFCEIRNNSSAHYAGGITNRGQLTLNSCRVAYNSGITGGGIYNQGKLTVTNTTIAYNSAGQGAGIYNAPFNGVGVLALDHALINNNQSAGDGGGIYNEGTLQINNTGINNNSSGSRGGGMINHGTATVENVSIVGNTAAWQGGGIQTGGNIALNNATISSNTSVVGGGIFVSQEFGSARLKNTILANNTASTSGADCSGPLLSSGNNIIRNTGSCVMTASNGDLLNVNPQLGTFLPSEGYIPLRLNSPAIDAGDDPNCPSTDQRGLTRPYGSHCDIGAYEAEYILISGNAGKAGVALSYMDAGTPLIFRADSKGNYLVRVPKDWSGTVTPSKIGYTFTPSDRTYSHLQSFQTGQDYTAQYVGGADTTGVFRPSNGLLYLKNKNDTGFADMALNYGLPGDYPVVGDWDSNGTVTIGIYRNGYFYLRNENTIGFAEVIFPFGQPGDQPIAGDWDGDDVDTIGVYRPSTGQFLLRNSNTEGAAEMSFYLGNVGDVGIAGDWDGDGIDTTGVFRPSNGIIFLKNTNVSGFADIALNYGLPGDKPITGDWDGDGIDTIGIYRNGTFYLRNANTIGFADIVFGLGNPGDMPIAGNWDGLP